MCVWGGGEDEFHQAKTDDVAKTLRSCAPEAGGLELYATLQPASDTPAHVCDVYYHGLCFTKLRNTARSAAAVGQVSSSAKGSRYHDSLVMAQFAVYVLADGSKTCALPSPCRGLHVWSV